MICDLKLFAIYNQLSAVGQLPKMIFISIS